MASHRNSKLKILFIVNSLKETGPTNQLYYILSSICKKNFSIALVRMSADSPKNTLQDKFRELDIELLLNDSHPVYGVISSTLFTHTAIKTFNPDVIHTQGIRADVLSALLQGNTSTKTASVRNYPHEDYPALYGRILGRAMATVHLHAYKKLNPIFCSKSIAVKFAKLGISGTTIQNGVDTDKFGPAIGIDKKRLRSELNLPQNGILFIASGPLIERKNYRHLFEGYLKLPKSIDAHLIILGDGIPLKQWKNEYADSNIIFAGHTSTVAKYLNASDYFVSTSLSEGLPNAVLEAMSTNLVCLLSDITPHLEVSKNSSNRLFSLSHIKHLTDCLTEAAENHKKFTNRPGNRALIVAEFGKKAMADNFERTFNTLSNRNHEKTHTEYLTNC